MCIEMTKNDLKEAKKNAILNSYEFENKG
jgi:hypothetical protein